MAQVGQLVGGLLTFAARALLSDRGTDVALLFVTTVSSASTRSSPRSGPGTRPRRCRAAGVLAPPFGLVLRPDTAALSMSGSSFPGAVNALMRKRLHLPAAGAGGTVTTVDRGQPCQASGPTAGTCVAARPAAHDGGT